MVPTAGIQNATRRERARAWLGAARRRLRRSLALSMLVLALAVGAAQAAALLGVHDVSPPVPMVAAVIVVLAALACLWVGTFGFVALVTRRPGTITALATTLVFYGLTLPIASGNTLLSLLGLLPPALAAAPLLARLPWPPLAHSSASSMRSTYSPR